MDTGRWHWWGVSGLALYDLLAWNLSLDNQDRIFARKALMSLKTMDPGQSLMRKPLAGNHLRLAEKPQMEGLDMVLRILEVARGMPGWAGTEKDIMVIAPPLASRG